MDILVETNSHGNKSKILNNKKQSLWLLFLYILQILTKTTKKELILSSFGIVRKVDELGRIVIPKEIRKILDIKTGSSLEININENKELILKKFSEIKNISNIENLFLDSFFNLFQIPILLCNEEKVIYCVGVNKKEFLEKEMIDEIKNLNSRESKLFNGDIIKEQKTKYNDSLIISIFVDGYACGKLIVFKKEEGVAFDKEMMFCLNLIADYITRVLNFE